jgi:hypothetical protein
MYKREGRGHTSHTTLRPGCAVLGSTGKLFCQWRCISVGVIVSLWHCVSLGMNMRGCVCYRELGTGETWLTLYPVLFFKKIIIDAN